MKRRFETNGKEVLRDGKHYADAVDENAAIDIVYVLNRTEDYIKNCFEEK